MTDRPPYNVNDPDAPAVDLAALDPKLQLALRHVANVDECCRTLLEILDAMPVIEGLTTTVPDGQEQRPRIWIHDALRACERLPGTWQRDVRRAWQLLGDSVNLYNQTVSSIDRYVERVSVSLNGRLTTSAHKWARRFLDQYAGDLEHVQTLLEGSETAFDELETNSLVAAQSSDPLTDEASMFEVMETMEALAGMILGKLADAGLPVPTEPAPLSNGTLLPLKLAPGPEAAILGLLPAAADDDAVDDDAEVVVAEVVVADDAAADDTADDDVSVVPPVPAMLEDELSALLCEPMVNATRGAVEDRDRQPDTDQPMPAHLADETAAARCRRTVRRYQWAVGALCAAAVVILVVAGMMTYAAQERARDAAKQAEVRIADAENEATRAVEQARIMRDAPVAIEEERPGDEIDRWWIPPGGQFQVGNRTFTLRRSQ